MKLVRNTLKAAPFKGLVWLDGVERAIDDFAGRVVLVHFWDLTCIHCLRAMTYVQMWHGRYADKGLQIIAIDAPEFDFAKDIQIVRTKVEELGLQFPVAIDRDFLTWDAYANRHWPATYLIDRKGYLAHYQFGEGAYQDTEEALQHLLREGHSRLILPKVLEPLRTEDRVEHERAIMSPAIYFGYGKGRIGNHEGFRPGEIVEYSPPPKIAKDVYALEGSFKNESYAMTHVGTQEGRIIVNYVAGAVHLVATPGAESGHVTLFQDGQPLSDDNAGIHLRLADGSATLDVSHPAVFNLVQNRDGLRHTLEMRTTSPDLSLYGIDFSPSV